jgi:hypothetical protein
MRCFIDDDAGYLSWLSDNPDGYVANTYRSPSPSYLMIHRATCQSINKLRGDTWTAGDYRKVCGDRAELERWAHDRVGGRLRPCAHCM